MRLDEKLILAAIVVALSLVACKRVDEQTGKPVVAEETVYQGYAVRVREVALSDGTRCAYIAQGSDGVALTCDWPHGTR